MDRETEAILGIYDLQTMEAELKEVKRKILKREREKKQAKGVVKILRAAKRNAEKKEVKNG